MSLLAPKQFSRIAKLAKSLWGLDLTERKQQLVANRLGKFLRTSPFDSVDAYLDHVETDCNEDDRLLFFDLLSTNVTSFFREPESFAYLEREFWTPLARGTLTRPGRRLRIWSAACSTGPEPYSLAIHAHEHLPNVTDWDLRILATDLAVSALETARKATYPVKMVEHLPKELVRTYFRRGHGDQAGHVRVTPAIRKYVTFGQLNLMNTWPVKGPFDVIFCRNVMIYFDKPTRTRLVQRFYDLLRPGGILVIGSAETLAGTDTALRTGQPSVYVK